MKNALFSCLLIAISFPFLFAQNPAGQFQPILQYEGMYQSDRIGAIGNLRCYLKFYSDGTVLRTFSNLDTESPAQVKARLNRLNALKTTGSVSSGRFFRLGLSLNCSFGSGATKESYQINIIELGLIASYKGSLVQRQEVYSYLPDLVPPAELFGDASHPKVFAVLVGVARYDHINSLDFTDDDAYRLYAFLKSPEGGALPDNQIRILIDQAATRDKILEAMRSTFNQAGPNDLVLFYFSGHGENGAFLPADFNGFAFKLSHNSIREIFDQSKAKHKVLIADACHSGSMDKGVKSQFGSIYDSYYTALSQSSGGMALFMSSKSTETSLEIEGLRQGVFTYYMLQGLKGAADSNNNKVITIQELHSYVSAQVRSFTANRQSPVINGAYDPNMPLGVLR